MPISCLLQQCFLLLSCLLQVRLVEVLVVEEVDHLDPVLLVDPDHLVHQREIPLELREHFQMGAHFVQLPPVVLPMVSNIEPVMELQEKHRQ